MPSLAQLWRIAAVIQGRPPDPPVGAQDARRGQRSAHDDLAALDAWYTEWAEIVRAVVSRRSDRIALRIAMRRKADRGQSTETEDTVGTAPTPRTTVPVVSTASHKPAKAPARPPTRLRDFVRGVPPYWAGGTSHERARRSRKRLERHPAPASC